MVKVSNELRKLKQVQQKQNPGFNFLPTPGEAYPNGTIAYQIMLASGDRNVWVEVEYLDENGDTQKRMLSGGIWPIMTTQINGYRPHNNLAGALNASVGGEESDTFQITVLMQ